MPCDSLKSDDRDADDSQADGENMPPQEASLARGTKNSPGHYVGADHEGQGHSSLGKDDETEEVDEMHIPNPLGKN